MCTVRERYPAPEMGARQEVDSRPLWPRLVRETALKNWPSTDESSPPPADPCDELFLLGERCAQAYMQADALHYRAMKLLAEFHQKSGWQDTGFSSTAEWLAWRIGIQPGAARERLRTALALEQLPETSEAMKNGEISFTKVRALTRVATPENEATLLDFARAGSAANLERMVRGWKTLDRKSELTAEQIRHRSRQFSAWVDDDGMVVVKGRLDPEVGALLMRVVEAGCDALYREKGQGEEEDPVTGLDVPTPEQRRADAVGLVAERAMAAGFGKRCESGGEPGAENESENDDAIPVSGSRAERYQVMLHVDAGTREEHGEPGQSELEDGTRVSAETSRRAACDSGLVEIRHAPDGSLVGAGRRTRTVPPSVRRALEARDRGCRFPGCGLRFTDAHHVKHWADGGETTLRNLVLLCRRHHRTVHEGGVQVCIDANEQVVFFTPKGKTLLGAPPVRGRPVGGRSRGGRFSGPHSLGGERLGEGAAEGGSRGAGLGEDASGERCGSAGKSPQHGDDIPWDQRPRHLTGAPRFKRDSDIPWDVEAQAWEALDPG